MPPPMISRRFGTSVSSSAPVESMRRLSSYGKPGMRADCDPAAMMQWSKETVLMPSLVSTARRCGDANWPRALDHGDLARLGQRAEAAGQLGHHAVLELAQARRGRSSACRTRAPRWRALLRVGDHLRGVQQGLGRNAADVQADAADARVALDEDHLLAEVRRAKRRGVAAGAGAQHQHLGVKGRVGVLRGARSRRHGRGRGRTGRMRGRGGRLGCRRRRGCGRRFFLVRLGGRAVLRLGRGSRRRERLRPPRASR